MGADGPEPTPRGLAFADGTSAIADFAWCPPTRYGKQNTFDDTWVWEGDRWRRIPRPAGIPWPHARWGASLAYDRTTGSVVLFGGLYQTTSPSAAESGPDVVNCWGSKNVQPATPSDGVIKYQSTPITSVTVPTGSDGAQQALTSLCFQDTWLFDGFSWKRATPAAKPSARFEQAMSGGRACAASLDPASSSCGPSSGLPTVFSGCEAIGMVGSHGRPDLAVSFDCSNYAGAQTIYTVTNGVTGEIRERKATMGDTWVWKNNNWVKGCPGPASGGTCRPIAGKSYNCSTPRAEIYGISLCAPSARRGATMTYNPATGGVLLFGGYTFDPVWGYRGHAADTWQWDAGTACLDTNDGPRSGPCWRLVMADWKAYHWTTPLPGGRGWGASTTAGVGGQWRVVLFGGHGYSRFDAADPTGPESRYAESLNDTWVWLDGAGNGCTDGTDRYDTTCWQPCTTCLGSTPAKRAAANLEYDSARGKMVLFGGVCETYCEPDYGGGDQHADTWTLLAPPPIT